MPSKGSSTWTSSTDPPLSIIVASNGAPGALESCLGLLESQAGGAEVLVGEPSPSPDSLRERFPFARFFARPGALVPELWRDGIDASRGRIVALTISPMRPADDWVATIHAQHEHREVVAGALDPADDLRIGDWAEFFCRYSRDMLPFETHECLDLPGDNATYKRELLERTREVYRDGFWEPDVHRALRAEGVPLWHVPELVVRQGRSAGVAAFTRQRLLHGRAYGGQRGAHFGVVRNLLGIIAAPAVPALLTGRVGREVLAKRRLRGRLLAALP
ncbi:MAG: hypothetical protein M3540_02635, partial [Actinomycetota bacterium]|nr:hypothetical protein [Actinomycetota bacterium]